MNSNKLQKILDNHKLWLHNDGGERADLRKADLRKADLQWADLQWANLDFSCLPLWWDASQIAAHFCALDCDDKDFQKACKAILKFALTNKHAGDLGLEK